MASTFKPEDRPVKDTPVDKSEDKDKYLSLLGKPWSIHKEPPFSKVLADLRA